MIDSDIMGNIATEMIEAHPADCTCDCCCVSESNCLDNVDECAELGVHREGRK